METKLKKFSVWAQDGDDLYIVSNSNSKNAGRSVLMVGLIDVNGKRFEVQVASTPDGHFEEF